MVEILTCWRVFQEEDKDYCYTVYPTTGMHILFHFFHSYLRICDTDLITKLWTRAALQYSNEKENLIPQFQFISQPALSTWSHQPFQHLVLICTKLTSVEQQWSWMHHLAWSPLWDAQIQADSEIPRHRPKSWCLASVPAWLSFLSMARATGAQMVWSSEERVSGPC